MVYYKGMHEPKLNIPASQMPVFAEPQDFRASMHWRIFRIMAELMDGWQFLADFRNSVAIFGSANVTSESHWYQEADKLGRILAEAGVGVVTEGGPGIMEAANHGATLAKTQTKGDSLGLNIKSAWTTRINPYVRKSIAFHYFFVRSLMMSYSAKAYVYFPGGLGTLDHLTAIVTLIQTKKIGPDIPVILVGKEFWQPVAGWIKRTMADNFKTIDVADMAIYTIVDTAEEAFELAQKGSLRDEF